MLTTRKYLFTLPFWDPRFGIKIFRICRSLYGLYGLNFMILVPLHLYFNSIHVHFKCACKMICSSIGGRVKDTYFLLHTGK